MDSSDWPVDTTPSHLFLFECIHLLILFVYFAVIFILEKVFTQSTIGTNGICNILGYITSLGSFYLSMANAFSGNRDGSTKGGRSSTQSMTTYKYLYSYSFICSLF